MQIIGIIRAEQKFLPYSCKYYCYFDIFGIIHSFLSLLNYSFTGLQTSTYLFFQFLKRIRVKYLFGRVCVTTAWFFNLAKSDVAAYYTYLNVCRLMAHTVHLTANDVFCKPKKGLNPVAVPAVRAFDKFSKKLWSYW